MKGNKYIEAKKLPVICCTVVTDHIQQDSNFSDFSHSGTPAHCGHGVNIASLLKLPHGYKFCIHEAALLKQFK